MWRRCNELHDWHNAQKGDGWVVERREPELRACRFLIPGNRLARGAGVTSLAAAPVPECGIGNTAEG
jgi:hypothetical protein